MVYLLWTRTPKQRRFHLSCGAVAVLCLVTLSLAPDAARSQVKILDPRGWGSDHVGRPVPEYIHGDECLFCHRNDIGPAWQKVPHGISTRDRNDAPELETVLQSQPALAEISSQVEYFMGSRSRLRFLRKEGYGRFALLSTQAVLAPDGSAREWIDLAAPVWDGERFAARCAGCHATGVDSASGTFAAFGFDCYACHGDVSLEHTADTSRVWLSKKRRRDGLAITSICAQCHLREGRSRSTGRPYPNNFVAGDNLFLDFEADLSRAEDPRLNPGDRHVYRNVRDVVLHGKEDPTCLSCHQVHSGSSSRHRLALRSPICLDCHREEGPMKDIRPFEVRSALCEY